MEEFLKYEWLMRRAFFLNSGQKFTDPDWLRHFILSIRTKYQKHNVHSKDSLINRVFNRKNIYHISVNISRTQQI